MRSIEDKEDVGNLWGLHFLPTFIIVVSVSMIFYTISRLIFYFNNLESFHMYSHADTILAFLEGLRFDVSALFLINTPFFLLALIPLKMKLLQSNGFKNFLLTVWALLNLPLYAIGIADTEYIKFSGRRSDLGLKNLAFDIIDQFWVIMQNYYLIFALLAVVTSLHFFSVSKTFNKIHRAFSFSFVQKKRYGIGLPGMLCFIFWLFLHLYLALEADCKQNLYPRRMHMQKAIVCTAP